VFEGFKDWFHLHYQILKDFAAPSVALLGLLLTVGIAIAGFKSFGRWKREKIEERRIEVALDALAIAYEARFRMEAIRSRFPRESELVDERKKNADGSYVAATLREGQSGPYAVLKRLRANGDYWETVYKIEPKFMAIFGAETQEIFQLLYDAKTIVETSASALFEEAIIEHDPDDREIRERLRKLRVDAFASKGKNEDDDRVGQKILEFQKQVESLCRPIVDQTFGRRSRKSKSPV
jgi:hypothetical protein